MCRSANTSVSLVRQQNPLASFVLSVTPHHTDIIDDTSDVLGSFNQPLQEVYYLKFPQTCDDHDKFFVMFIPRNLKLFTCSPSASLM